ncbi:MAG: PA2169 family four-helix-bundle protein [Bacteroidetes bacterium]|nr:PA2169 family four-helix-bundle protein [Bacteroidota bacterium]
METEKSITALNKLIEINNDRIEGYVTASKETKEVDLKSLFSELIKTSQQCRAELANEVHKLGGTPVEGTKISGKFFRVWMDVKAALVDNDRKTILNSCETGEDVAVDTYKEVLDESLSAVQQLMISDQLRLIKADHDKIKNLRDSIVNV